MNEQDPHIAEQRRLGGRMYIGFWILLLVLVGYLFSGVMDHDRNPNRDVESRVAANGSHEVTLKRSRSGHYHVSGEINGQRVEFMLDTGATDIVVPASLAQEMGLRKLDRMRFNTANGVAYGYSTYLDSVRIGNIELRGLQASINPNVNDSIVLLGMSFLKRVDFSQRGDTLILRQ